MPQSIDRVNYITLAEACKRIPGRPHINSVRRWCDRGHNGAVLESWRFAGKRVTTVAAIDEFFRATSARSAETTADCPATDCPTEAERKLDQLGVRL